MQEHAHERNLIINGRELNYKGIFKIEELYAVINEALKEKGYHKREKKSEETVTPEGKRVYIELRPYKHISDFITLMIKIKVSANNLTENVEEIKGVKRKYNLGDVQIIFDAWVMSDYHSRWGMRPFFYFMKTFVNKFIYTFPMEANAPGEVGEDTAYIYANIKKLLNSYRGKDKEDLPDAETIRKELEEDIKKVKKELKK